MSAVINQAVFLVVERKFLNVSLKLKHCRVRKLLIEEAKKVVRTYYEDQVNAAIENIKVMYTQTHHKQLNFH